MCDLILFNANAITMDPARPKAGLVAIDGNQIATVGGNEALTGLRRPKPRIIDCHGRTLLPGFVDAHCHVHAYAESLVSLDLSPREQILSIPHIQRRIRDACEKLPAGTWIRARACNEFYLAERRLPNRWELDVAAPSHPVKITHRSGHAHVLNSVALQHVGISEGTGDPPEGLIDRDLETGLPTGILYGMSAYLAGKIPPLEAARLERGLRLANENLLSYGITSIQDASAVNGLREWRWFENQKARGVLQPRLTMMRGWKGFEESLPGSFGSPLNAAHLRPGGVKIIAGLVTGSLHPSRNALNDQVSAIHRAGLQAVIHAVEEPVIEAACDAIASALRQSPGQDHRHRIEHCSVCPPALLRRLGELHITVVTQPSFIYFNGDRYLETVPSDELEHLYPLDSIVRSGLPVAAGSDFPICDPNPLVGIGAAVNRTTESGKRVLPQQGISVSAALKMYTLGAAGAGCEEGIKGSISPGKFADLVLLEEDPFAVDPVRIKDIRAMMTILDGKVVWESARQ